LQVLEVMKLLLAHGADKKAFCVSGSDRIYAADAVRLVISDLDEGSWPTWGEVRTGLREVLAIIEDDKSNEERVKKTSTITKYHKAEDQNTPVSFAGSSRSEPHNTLLSQKASLSQRIKAKFLKRVR
jgi:hypothetical protein